MDADFKVAQMRRLLRRERYGQALGLLPVADSAGGEVLFLRGVARHGVNDHTGAIQDLACALNDLPSGNAKAQCLLELAIAYNKTGDTVNAKRCCDACADLPASARSLNLALELRYVRIAIASRDSRYDEVIKLARQLATDARRHDQQGLWVRTNALAALAHRVCGKYSQALRLVDRSIGMARRLGLTYRIALLETERAIVLYERGALGPSKTAVTHAQTACSASGAQLLMGDILVLKANLFATTASPAETVQRYEDAACTYIKAGFKEGAAIALGNVAKVYLDCAEFGKALHALRRALAYASRHSRAHSLIKLDQGRLYKSIGLATHAREAFLEALQGFEQLRLWIHVTQAAMELASISDGGEQWLLIRQASRAASRMEKSAFMPFIDRSKGEIAALRGDRATANRSLARSVSSLRQMGFLYDSAVTELLSLELNAARGRASRLERKLQVVGKQLSGLPEFDSRLALLQAQACLERQDHNAAHLALEDSLRSINLLLVAGADMILAGHTAGARSRFFRRAQGLAHELQANDLCLQSAELRRAVWLRQVGMLEVRSPMAEALGDHRNKAIADRVRRMREQIRGIASGQIARDPVHLEALRRDSREIRRAYLEYDADRHMDGAMSASQSARPSITSAKVASLQRQLSKLYGTQWSAVVLEPLDPWQPGAKSEPNWLRILLTPEAISVTMVTASPSLRMCIDELAKGDPQSRRIAYGLSHDAARMRQLVAEAMQINGWLPPGATNHTLILCPCAPFDQIAFAALPHHGRPLAEATAIRYAPSLSLGLALRQRRRRASRGATAMFIAPGTYDGAVPELPHTVHEVESLGVLWPNARTVTGPAATCEWFWRSFSPGRSAALPLAHIASHAEFYADTPRLSGLWMQDGVINLERLLELKIPADLVILSACDGSRLMNAGGDDQISLETALFAAGAKAVMSSRWIANDEATNAFMQDVHHALRMHGDAGKALAEAQRQRLDRPPFEWAGWKLSGL